MNRANILSIQLNPKSLDKFTNLQKVATIIDNCQHKNLDLIVIPEFFSVGICHDFTKTAEDENGGDTIQTLSKLAKKYKTNIICGTVIEKVNNKFYNTSFVVDRNGTIVGKYRKIHLFNYFGGNEGTYTTAGNEVVIADLDFAKVGMSICFDIKFPTHYRKLIMQGAEIIVAPAAWLNLKNVDELSKKTFERTWQSMNICRATENLTYFISSNLTGNIDDNFYGIGNSMIVDPMGKVIVQGDDEEKGFFAEINLDYVRKLKTQVPIAKLE